MNEDFGLPSVAADAAPQVRDEGQCERQGRVAALADVIHRAIGFHGDYGDSAFAKEQCDAAARAGVVLFDAGFRILNARVKELETTLKRVIDQYRVDLGTAHAEICTLQRLDPEAHSWPEWSPQANTLRWLPQIEVRLGLTSAALSTQQDSHATDKSADPSEAEGT